MRDEEDAQLGTIGAHLLHTAGDDLQGVDVESGVGLIEDGEVGLEDRHLQDLVALLLPAGEALVEVAVAEGGIHVEALHPLHDRQAQLEDRQVDALAGRQGLAQEVDDRDARDLLGVLEGEEHPRLAAHVGRPRRDVLALEEEAPGRHLVVRVAEEGVGERRLPRAVGAHQGVHLARQHCQLDALEDLLALDGDMEALDAEERRAGAHFHRSLITLRR